jgi:hypothetical protein
MCCRFTLGRAALCSPVLTQPLMVREISNPATPEKTLVRGLRRRGQVTALQLCRLMEALLGVLSMKILSLQFLTLSLSKTRWVPLLTGIPPAILAQPYSLPDPVL